MSTEHTDVAKRIGHLELQAARLTVAEEQLSKAMGAIDDYLIVKEGFREFSAHMQKHKIEPTEDDMQKWIGIRMFAEQQLRNISTQIKSSMKPKVEVVE